MYLMMYMYILNQFFLATPLYLIYNNSGYNDNFYLAIRSHGIDYAATLTIALWINRLPAYNHLTLWKKSL